MYEEFFKKFSGKFIVGGDFNAKHPWWGSRLTNCKGRELYKCIVKNHYNALATGTPTYWPSDPHKVPDLLDFFVHSGISTHSIDIINCDELSSDHTPIIACYRTSLPRYEKNTKKILNNKTNIKQFKYIMDTNINLNISIKSACELDNAVEKFTNVIHEAAYLSTPPPSPNSTPNKVIISSEIRNLIAEKRRLRKTWQNTRHPSDKSNFNRACEQVKQRLRDFKNESTTSFLKNLGYTKETNHNLWRATKYIKRPTKRNVPIKASNGNWYRTDKDKTLAFADHLQNTFQPFYTNTLAERTKIDEFLNSANQMDWPIQKIIVSELESEISNLNPRKSPGHDKIDALILKSLPKSSLKFLTLLYNSILRISHFPTQWKCAEIILVPKPGKPEHEVTSYRPISLLSTFSKVFERLLLRRMYPILEAHKIIPEHQFGFRKKHGTIEQCHRVVNIIRNSLENKKYCCAVFLDIKQAFDKVWHEGLWYKLKKLLPSPIYMVLRSYLQERSFFVRVNSDTSEKRNIFSGVPQGSVIGPLLYTLYTSDMPTSNYITCATYADDTALLHQNESPAEAVKIMQQALVEIQKWLNKWNIRVNTEKSAQITFALRKGDCPNLILNDATIPIRTSVKYLGLKLDKRLTWKNHIKDKRQELNVKLKKLYWILNPKSELSLDSKLQVCASIYNSLGIGVGDRELRNYIVQPNAPDEEKRSALKKLLQLHPPVFHQWFLQRFVTPRSWYEARCTYMKTLAVMSMVGYVLGLGDRHGENILLDETNGDIVHVDFNCLFNQGELFQYPERVPFRLTQNMVHAMGALSVDGLYRRCCEITLHLLRDKSRTLNSVLRPFIYDCARRNSRANLGIDSATPAEARNPKALSDMLRLENRLKGLVKNSQLSVKGHVDLLIKDARDLENLAGMYIGWTPHL